MEWVLWIFKVFCVIKSLVLIASHVRCEGYSPAASVYHKIGSPSPVVRVIVEADNSSTSAHTIRLLSA